MEQRNRSVPQPASNILLTPKIICKGPVHFPADLAFLCATTGFSRTAPDRARWPDPALAPGTSYFLIEWNSKTSVNCRTRPLIAPSNHAATRRRVRHSANSFPPVADSLGSFKPLPFLNLRLCSD